MTCKDCLHYDVCYKKPDHFDDLSVNGGCKDFADKSRYIELPCKVGDTIYFDTYKRGESIGIKPHKVAKVEVVVSTERPFGCVGAEIPDWQFGKTVFLTREEAEKALKERERDNGAYSLGIPDAYHLPTACPESGIPSIGKDSIGKYSIEIEGAAPPSSTRHKYGTYKNVLLSDDDMDKLKAEFPDYEERIERLSDYIAQSGKSYKSHLAVIRNWAKCDKEEKKSKAKETPQGSFDTDDFFAAALAASMGENYGKNIGC